MTQFAKLFDVADTQVLFRITTGDDDRPVLQVSTQVTGLDVSANISFNHPDADAAWEKADAMLAAMTQESAIRFYADMAHTITGDDQGMQAQGAKE